MRLGYISIYGAVRLVSTTRRSVLYITLHSRVEYPLSFKYHVAKAEQMYFTK